MNIELTAEIRFRCPSCQKLYCSDETAFSTNPDIPSEFECASCSESFFLYQTKTETNLYRTEKTTETELVKCPKCNSLKPKNQNECSNCGIFESKYKEIQKLESPRLFQIDQAWSKVLTDLTNDSNHQNFLNLAQSHMALNFASQKYLDLQKTMGHDPIIEKYLKQVELRLMAMVQTRFQTEKELAINNSKDQENLFERIRSMSAKNIFMTVSLFGTAILIYNKINPTFPNLTGLIVAATILSYGLWFISINSNTKI